MTDLDIRVLDDSWYRAAHTLFRGTLHHGPASDERWEVARGSYGPGRSFGAFAGDELIGTVHSFPSALAVPGGAVVPMAAVSRVGVRADWTRRGVLTALQRAQLRALRESGEVAATLRASEGLIYERFGYGVATRFREVRIQRARARSRLPIAGRVRLVAGEPAAEAARALFERVSPGRAGTIARWPAWWDVNLVHGEDLKVAVAAGPDGDDGYVVYRVVPRDFTSVEVKPSVLVVMDLWAETPRAWSDLWAFVLGIDLVDDVVAGGRPLDEPLEWLLADRRALRVVDQADETWLRLLDVEAALAARSYRAGDPVVIGVRDRFLPENEGAYRVTPAGASRTTGEPDFVVDVEALAAAYLGDVTFSALAVTGRLTTDAPDALTRADTLFAVTQPPWSGTFF